MSEGENRLVAELLRIAREYRNCTGGHGSDCFRDDEDDNRCDLCKAVDALEGK